jgi:hypothetical protein
MNISRESFDRVRLWVTFSPILLLYLAGNYSNMPPFYLAVFTRLYLIALVSTFLIDALLFKELSAGWCTIPKSKSPNFYKFWIVIMTVTILFFITKTLADIVNWLNS